MVTDKKKLVISFSGGQTSAFMTQWLLANCADEYEMKVVFANTGKENEETLKFVQKCSEYFGFECTWVEAITNNEYGIGVGAKVVDFFSADRMGLPFSKSIEKFGLPNKSYPHCSRDLKQGVIGAYLRSIGWKKYYTAIGIRVDEIDRMNEKKDKLRFIYPLISSVPMTKKQVNDYWSKMPFKLNLKEYEGNCDCCWKKSIRKLVIIARETPEKFEWWKEQEKKYENYIPDSRKQNENIKLPFRIYRENRSVDEILRLAKLPQPIDIFEDVSNGCEESCEAF